MKIPPLLLMVLIALAMYLLAPFLPLVTLYETLAIYMAAAILFMGVVIGLLAVWEFRRADTTVDPIHVEKVSRLVESGIYRFSRNPMYVSFALILLALAIYLRSPLLVGGVIFFVGYINLFQIESEEKFMREKFGADYDNYARRVRRWI